MDTIPSVFWMVIIAVIAIMICLVLYYVAMLLKETKDAVGDSRKLIQGLEPTMKQVDLIIADVQSTTSMLKGTVQDINEGIVMPIRNIGSAFSAMSGLVSGLRKGK